MQGGNGRTGNQAAPAHRGKNMGQSGPFLQEFLGRGPLPEDDLQIVGGMKEGGAPGIHDILRALLPGLKGGCTFHEHATIALYGIFLDLGRRTGHDDIRLDPQTLGGQGHGLCKITGGMGHHAPGLLGIGELHDRIGGPAHFEGAPFLEVLAFEKKPGPRHFIDQTGSQDRGMVDIGPNASVCLDDGVFVHIIVFGIDVTSNEMGAPKGQPTDWNDGFDGFVGLVEATGIFMVSMDFSEGCSPYRSWTVSPIALFAWQLI